MNKTLISIEELKQIALSEIHTYPVCRDVSTVGMYPVTDDVVESNWSVQVVSGEGVDPKPQTALRFTLCTSFVMNTIC
jgi:hypothetical protein